MIRDPVDDNNSAVYVIQSNDPCFVAGITAIQQQILMGPFRSEFIVLIFDMEGNLLEVRARPLIRASGSLQGTESTHVNEPSLWEDNTGYRNTPIAVKRFFLTDRRIGILDIPQFFSDFLNEPSFVKDEDERQEWNDDISQWRESGQYVLCWGKDFWMTPDGEVSST